MQNCKHFSTEMLYLMGQKPAICFITQNCCRRCCRTFQDHGGYLRQCNRYLTSCWHSAAEHSMSQSFLELYIIMAIKPFSLKVVCWITACEGEARSCRLWLEIQGFSPPSCGARCSGAYEQRTMYHHISLERTLVCISGSLNSA